ncbi:TolA-binding protein [Shimia gijangensis]|uniref:TolA-binding protein n=1 Tax=Shimia gijangensis TaxID=1470563 RepID=A0A1M6IFK3_9RHOB|nr:tetratricopeptide repeat protein [Shimia gijangensis]SHJ33195.1 TolA-binding protein [Shimia gijangensis]
MRLIAVCLIVLAGGLPRAAVAQNSETLADIRQQLTVLYVEIQSLKRELSTTQTPLGVTTAGSTLERIDAIEAELQRLTGRTEQLSNRVEHVVEDGTNRVSDLEFRLVELEGGDVSQLGETTTLGGDVVVPATLGGGETQTAAPETSELAVGESADYQRAKSALDGGDYVSAANQFSAFLDTYPGSPLAPEAHLGRGMSLEGQEPQTQEAKAAVARAYLESYSINLRSPVADQSLFHLGKALGALGKTNEACVTLGEVQVRHPGSDMVLQAQSEMRNLGCP